MLAMVASIGIAIAAIINLLPVVGVLGANWLKSLYGFDLASADLEILLRHRAILFGLVGLLLLGSLVWPHLRGAALLVGVGSMMSFIVIALVVGGYSHSINKIIIADVIGLIALAPAIAQRFQSN